MYLLIFPGNQKGTWSHLQRLWRYDEKKRGAKKKKVKKQIEEEETMKEREISWQ